MKGLYSPLFTRLLLVGLAHHAGLSKAQSTPLDLIPFVNNKAFGTAPGEASFDTTNRSFPSLASLAPNGTYRSTLTGVSYSFPGLTEPGENDNVICAGQTIPVLPVDANGSYVLDAAGPSYFSLSLLVATDIIRKTVSKSLTLTWLLSNSSTGNTTTTTTAELRVPPAWSWPTLTHGEIVAPYTFTDSGIDWNTSQIFEVTTALAPLEFGGGAALAAVTLPNTTVPGSGRIHVFAMTAWSRQEGETNGATAAGPVVDVQNVRATQKWTDLGVQVVEVTVNNVGEGCISGQGLQITIEGAGIQTVQPGGIKRLCAGDQKRVNVGVRGTSSGTVTVVITNGCKTQTSQANVDIGLEDFTSDLDSLSRHESPQWYDDGKYGIFIHWGPYSVPGWGNSSSYETYAEWFWWYSTHHFVGADKSDDYDYRLRTFGPDWAYDDGFANFTGAYFDPKAWVDLFADAGAKYFVLTTKHHDGFAMFDTGKTTNRSALHYGPGRDVLKELFAAAETYQPGLKRGTYFSMPEWFNPDFGLYGFSETTAASSVSWLGIEATNPYTGAVEPYTGRVPIGDYITDLQRPQMEALAYTYGTDVMWCDVGGANDSAAFAAAWWNWARAQDRQVVMNSRCGVPAVADFETPEYATYSSAQLRKWESNRGMDPDSYGFNRATQPAAYMNASTVVYSLVDIVAKNGNFLLDIGPMANGTIDETEATNLREAGAWIKAHEEAIFGTTFWFVQTQIASPEVRFTQTDDAFYILFLEEPTVVNGTVVVDAPVPILKGDTVSLVGVAGVGNLDWTSQGGVLSIGVTSEALAQDQYCWVFKIEYAA